MAIFSYPQQSSITAVTSDFYLEVAKGNIPGHSYIHKFGYNPEIDNNSEPETVWSAGGLYPWSSLTTAQTLYLQSDDNNDTMTITVEGLDANFAPLSEDVTLNGTTSVTTTNQFSRVFRMKYDEGTPNEGAITARVGSGSGTVVAQIDEGLAQTLMALYTIPAGYTGYLLQLDISVQKNKDAQVKLFAREPDKTFRVQQVAEVHEASKTYAFPIPLRFPEKTDIEVQAHDVENNNTRVTSNFDMLLIQDGF